MLAALNALMPRGADAPAVQPGADFLRRRLARAQAVPQAERSPEVQAFIDGVALVRQMTELLPLNAHGLPAVAVESPEGEQRMLQSFLLWAAADVASPEQPQSDVNAAFHVRVYNVLLAAAEERGWRPQRAVLLDALRALLAGMLPGKQGASVEQQLNALRLLTDADTSRAARRQLAEVAAAAAAGPHAPVVPLPSLEQLRYTCHRIVLRTALLAKAGTSSSTARLFASAVQSSVPPQHAAALEAALAASAEALLAMQPNNSDSWLMAGQAAAAQLNMALAVERYLRGAELAQRQRADVAFGVCACGAATFAVAAPFHKLPAADAVAAFMRDRGFQVLTPALAERALAMVPDIEPAAKRATQLLPAPWVQSINHGLQMIQQQLAASRGEQPQPEASADSVITQLQASIHQAGEITAGATRAMLQAQHCAGCGMRSVGLRRCARCASVAYCSPECQRAHWRQHKPDCKPAG